MADHLISVFFIVTPLNVVRLMVRLRGVRPFKLFKTTLFSQVD